MEFLEGLLDDEQKMVFQYDNLDCSLPNYFVAFLGFNSLMSIYIQYIRTIPSRLLLVFFFFFSHSILLTHR